MKKHDSIFYRVMQIADSSHSEVSAIDAIEFRRDAYGFTREEMAKILGMRPSHYSEFVAGKISLPKRAALRAITIGVPPLAALNDTRSCIKHKVVAEKQKNYCSYPDCSCSIDKPPGKNKCWQVLPDKE